MFVILCLKATKPPMIPVRCWPASITKGKNTYTLDQIRTDERAAVAYAEDLYDHLKLHGDPNLGKNVCVVVVNTHSLGHLEGFESGVEFARARNVVWQGGPL